ncbi:MAG: flagellar hook-length control protein FliK [Methylovirgula sp.]|jgi:chemotaxis protein MotD
MNIIASLLKNFSPLPASTSFHPQDGSESSANAPAGKEKGFENILSGLAQNSETAGDGTSVTPQPRPAIRGAKGDDGSAGQAQDGGSDANPDPNAKADPIIVKNALTALQGANGAASDGNSAPSANGNASPLSLLSSALPGGAESAAQGEDTLFAGLDNQTQRNPDAGFSPKPNVAAFSAQQKAPASSQPLGPLIGSRTPNGAPTGLAQSAATTQSVSNRQLAASGANDLPPVPASNGGKQRIALVPGNVPNTGSYSPVAATIGNGAASSFVGKTQGQSDRPSAQTTRDANQPASVSNDQPQSVIAPDAAAMAANAGVAAGVVIAADLQTNAPIAPSSASNGQDGVRAGWTDRAGASAKQQKAVDQSAMVGDSGGSTEAVDPMAQVILVSQAAPASFDSGTGGHQEGPSGAAPPLPQPQISNPVFAAPNDSLAPLGGDTASDIKVTVLSSETHFAPPQRPSPVQQIVNAVSVALPPSPSLVAGAAVDSTDLSPATGSASAAGAVSANLDASGQSPGPVKVLNLQLEPPSLGSVTISLNLSSGGLSVQMAASQASTVSLIERDKNSLSDQLRDSGYSIAGVAVTLGPHQGAALANDGSATQGQAGQNFSQNSGQAMSSDGGSSNANGNGQNGGNRPLSDPTGGTPDSFTGAVGGGASSGDLYI